MPTPSERFIVLVAIHDAGDSVLERRHVIVRAPDAAAAETKAFDKHGWFPGYGCRPDYAETRMEARG